MEFIFHQNHNEKKTPFKTYRLPSRFMKCGYCRLKCKSKSVSSNGGLVNEPPPMALGDNIDCGTGISCDLNIRLELCILTANESDVNSGGSGVRSVKRVIVSEHNLKCKKKTQSISCFIKNTNQRGIHSTTLSNISVCL